MTGNEEDVIKYYERFWSKSELWWETDKTLAIHFGYYDKGIRSHSDAVLHMNDIAWQLLDLNVDTPQQVLDAGCGVGGTSIYLAQKYPHVIFTGITIVSPHVVMAKRFAEKRDVTVNTRFLEENYLRSSFTDQSFDGIIALESVIYAHRKEDLITELYRVLKPGGRIAILDGFHTGKRIPSSLEKIYDIWLEGRALVDVESINEFAACLRQTGFRDVTVCDVSAHVIPSYFFGMLVGSVLFIPALIKSIVRYRQHDYTDDFNCFMAVSLAGGLLALYGCFKYYSISATK